MWRASGAQNEVNTKTPLSYLVFTYWDAQVGSYEPQMTSEMTYAEPQMSDMVPKIVSQGWTMARKAAFHLRDHLRITYGTLTGILAFLSGPSGPRLIWAGTTRNRPGIGQE